MSAKALLFIAIFTGHYLCNDDHGRSNIGSTEQNIQIERLGSWHAILMVLEIIIIKNWNIKLGKIKGNLELNRKYLTMWIL